jgi:hypothetical protein
LAQEQTQYTDRGGHHRDVGPQRAAARSDFRGFYTPGGAVPGAQVLPDWIARHTLRPLLACSCTNAGLDAAAVLFDCGLDLAMPGQLGRPRRERRLDRIGRAS